MKICISADSGTLDAHVDPRFGRCPYFIIVDLETMDFEAIPNQAQTAGGGAGIQAAQTIADKGVSVVLTGSVGPNAFQALSAAGVRIFTGIQGSVREVIEKYLRGEFREAGTPGIRGHYGMGRGMGRRRAWNP